MDLWQELFHFLHCFLYCQIPWNLATIFFISLIVVSIIVSIIPEIIFSLLGTSIRKRYDQRSGEIDFNKYPYGSRFNWWNKIGSKGQATLIIAVYFIALGAISPLMNFNEFNFISGNSSLQSTVSSPPSVDERLNVEALQLIEKDGYWSSYHKQLKNGMVRNFYFVDGTWFGKVELDRDSVKILNLDNNSFMVQYRAVHHSHESDPYLYFDLVYLYTEKAVKSEGEWKLAGISKEPQFIKDESYKRWYSKSTNLWYREKLI